MNKTLKMKKPVNKPKFTNTRKVLRKEKRQQKKINRKEHYLKKKSDLNELKIFTAPGQFVKRRPESPELNNVSKKNKKPINQPTTQDILKRQQEKEKKEANKLKSQMSEQRRKMLVEANEDEDKIIKKLEKQLGLNKSRNKNNYFADDGLDYLLEVCERKTSEQIVAAEKHLADVEKDTDFEEDLAAVTSKDIIKKGSKKDKKVDDDSDDEMDVDEGMESDEDIGDEMLSEESEDMSDDNENDSNFGSDGDDDVNDDDEEEKSDEESEPIQLAKSKTKYNKNARKESVKLEEDINKVFSEDEISHLSHDEDLSDETGNENVVETDAQIEGKQKSDVWEDIYGRKRDKEGNIIKEEKGVYIPPHLRNKDSTSDKEIVQLKRQVKSVLNKLTGSNLHWSCSSVERLYSAHSRHGVSSVLCGVWRAAVVSVSLAAERLVAEHAALVAVLHANVGSEIGAHFLEDLCRDFDAMMETPQPIEDKTLDNLVVSLAHLYRFKVFDASLLFDVLSRLTHTLTEKNIDVTLACVRCAGPALRKDAPAALRDFTHHAHTRAAALQATQGSRIKYLLDVLLAIKNNNLNKIPNYDPSYVDHLIKTSRGIVRKGNYITPLNIRLEDLLNAHERGKWWVVGSAWAGTRPNTHTDTHTDPHTTLATDQKLLELARKQRMNTDVRRSIFCVIMAAEDYMDAFEKLQHLGLKGQQEREVVHVLIACCFQEKSYNPYYSVLATKLCTFDRKYQLSIQYSVWDKIKELESLSKQAMTNLAQFLIHLIMEKGLPLSVLKIIQFSDLNKRTVQFMRQILLAIIMNADLQASLEVFHRISKPPKLHMFRESLRLFIQHFLIKNAEKQSTILNEEEMSTLKERAQEVDKILTEHENKLRF